MTGIRLQLVLAKAGVASRRAAETLITAGRVAVNGRVVKELGTRVDPVGDRVSVDGREVQREAPAYYLLNKPKGYVTTAADPEGRPTVFDLLPRRELSAEVRLFAVGRLDFNTEGALLLTNDGELAHALMHPSRGIGKVYHAKLRGHITPEQVDRLRRGVVLPPVRMLGPDGKPLPSPYQPQRPPHLGPGRQASRHSDRRVGSERPERSAPCEIVIGKQTSQHTWLEVVLHEGKNRQIHRMAEAIGSSLLKLQRVQYASLSIADLPIGDVRPLTRREIAELRRSVGLSAHLEEPRPAAAPSKPRGAAPPPPRVRPQPESRPRTARAGRPATSSFSAPR